MDTRRAGLRELQTVGVVSAEHSVVDDPFIERRTRVLYRLHEASRADFRRLSGGDSQYHVTPNQPASATELVDPGFLP